MKRWTQFLALALAVVLLAGCSSNNAGNVGGGATDGKERLRAVLRRGCRSQLWKIL